MNSDPQLQELLSPLTEPVDALASRRLQVDREKIVSQMVAVSLAPEARFGSRARIAATLALAASFAFAGWGGLQLWRRGGASATSELEVVALRGQVTGMQGSKASGLGVGQPTQLTPDGTLETSQNAEARIKTQAGLSIELLENTKVALSELGVASTSSALRLEHGRVRCVIPHQPGRTFAVVTSAARVIDVGTIFSVSVEQTDAGPQTVVHVEEGEVLVQHAGGQSRLTAPQSWTSAPEPSKPPAEAARAEATVDDAAPATGPHSAAVRRHRETLAAETNLLRSGLASEQKGELSAAAAAFEKLMARYPESQLAPDAKAALARVKGRLESSK